MNSLVITAGILMWWQVRRFVKQSQKAGFDVKLIETPGYLQRRFILIGSTADITAVGAMLPGEYPEYQESSQGEVK